MGWEMQTYMLIIDENLVNSHQYRFLRKQIFKRSADWKLVAFITSLRRHGNNACSEKFLFRRKNCRKAQECLERTWIFSTIWVVGNAFKTVANSWPVYRSINKRGWGERVERCGRTLLMMKISSIRSKVKLHALSYLTTHSLSNLCLQLQMYAIKKTHTHRHTFAQQPVIKDPSANRRCRTYIIMISKRTLLAFSMLLITLCVVYEHQYPISSQQNDFF